MRQQPKHAATGGRNNGQRTLLSQYAAAQVRANAWSTWLPEDTVTPGGCGRLRTRSPKHATSPGVRRHAGAEPLSVQPSMRTASSERDCLSMRRAQQRPECVRSLLRTHQRNGGGTRVRVNVWSARPLTRTTAWEAATLGECSRLSTLQRLGVRGCWEDAAGR